MGDRDYRALTDRAAGRSSVLHLVREAAEASLCGIPRTALGPGDAGELVCGDCIAWLPRRTAFSGKYPRAKPT
jgi:hypothetical protein